MRGGSPVRPWPRVLAALLALGAATARAQDAPAEPPAAREPAARKPVPRAPVPRAPVPRDPVAAKPKPVPDAAPAPEAPPPVPAAMRPDLTVACAEKAALYEGPKNFSVWVTRTGLIVVENPLRPLTPETARVLQVVIAGKVATAYGPDLFALRRGAAPAALEGAKGGTIRWDATPTPLPDTLNIVSEAGQSLAQLAFQACGDPPAVAAPTARPKTPAAKAAARARAGKAAPGQAGAPAGIPLPAGALEP